jgi:hypothetical protein
MPASGARAVINARLSRAVRGSFMGGPQKGER